MAGKPTKIGDVDSKTPFGWAWVVNANEIEIRTARRDLKRDSADLHVAKLFSRLTIARNAEEAADEGHFVDLFDFEKFRGKPVINVSQSPIRKSIEMDTGLPHQALKQKLQVDCREDLLI